MKYLLPLIGILLPLKMHGQQYSTGLDASDRSYKNVSVKARLITRDYQALPKAVSLKQYCPLPGDQNCPIFNLHPTTKQPYCSIQRDGLGTCIAWSAAYAARTIMDARQNGWMDKNLITENAYSPGYTYHAIKRTPKCDGPNGGMPAAFRDMRDNGCAKIADFGEHCPDSISAQLREKAQAGKIKDFVTICSEEDEKGVKIQTVKKALKEGYPVVVGMICPNSLNDAKELWQPKEDPASVRGGHAMCIVGYDDAKYGGAFELLNSWGSSWGNAGYTWVSYDDFSRFLIFAFEIFPIDAPKKWAAEPPKVEPSKQPELKPNAKIVLTWNDKPTSTPIVTDKAYYSFSVHIRSLNRVTDIALYVNGALLRGQNAIPNAAVNNTKTWWLMNFEKSIPLYLGENRLKVTATSPDGTGTSEERLVIYRPKTESVVDFSGKLSFISSNGSTIATRPLKTRGQSVVSALDRGHYQTIQPVKSGDRYRILLSNNEPAYVYVLASDLTHQVSILFPHQENVSPALTYKSNHLALPDEEHWIELDNTIGKDYTCVLYSKEKLDIQAIQQQIQAGRGSFRERLERVLKDKLVDEKNVMRSETEVGFSAKSEGKSVMGLILEMEHQ